MRSALELWRRGPQTGAVMDVGHCGRTDAVLVVGPEPEAVDEVEAGSEAEAEVDAGSEAERAHVVLLRLACSSVPLSPTHCHQSILGQHGLVAHDDHG